MYSKVRYLINDTWKPVGSSLTLVPHGPCGAAWARRTTGDALRAVLGRSHTGQRPSAIVRRNVGSNDPTTKQIFQVSKVGCPIRRSMDQSSFAAPHGLSQRITSFIACACQGIHQMPLRHLIVLIANAHHLCWICKSDHPDNLAAAAIKSEDQRFRDYLLQSRFLMMPSTCSTDLLYWSYAEQLACSLS